MKILYDHQAFSFQNFGGISRYFNNLITEFQKSNDLDFEVSLLLSNNIYIKQTIFINHLNFLPSLNFKGKKRLFNLINKFKSINDLKNKNYDIFHPTYYDPYFLKYIDKKPFVLTVHDMIHEKFNKNFCINDRTKYFKKQLIKRAGKIIAVSNNTKNDLIKILGVDKSKIDVIYHGYTELNTDIKNPNFPIPNKYILYVGSRYIYKNFFRLINVFSKIRKIFPDLYLMCIGGGKFTNHEKKILRELNIVSKVLQYDINDKYLGYYYKHASAFIFPSLYEGFGIPILESFYCGCPVLCSNNSSLPEISEDAALYFDPLDESSIENAIIDILKNQELKLKLINKGNAQLKKFSWKKTKIETQKLYKSLI